VLITTAAQQQHEPSKYPLTSPKQMMTGHNQLQQQLLVVGTTAGGLFTKHVSSSLHLPYSM